MSVIRLKATWFTLACVCAFVFVCVSVSEGGRPVSRDRYSPAVGSNGEPFSWEGYSDRVCQCEACQVLILIILEKWNEIYPKLLKEFQLEHPPTEAIDIHPNIGKKNQKIKNEISSHEEYASTQKNLGDKMALIDPREFCIRQQMEYYARRTERLTTSEVLRACREIVETKKEALTEFLHAHARTHTRTRKPGDMSIKFLVKNQTYQQAQPPKFVDFAEFVCVPTLCQNLWEESDYPDKREPIEVRNLRLGLEFMEFNIHENGIERTSSGLQFRWVSKAGTEAHAHAQTHAYKHQYPHMIRSECDRVVVRGQGILKDGRQFYNTDESNDQLRGRAYLFPLGLIEGLRMMRVGDRIQLYVPPTLGYGAEGIDSFDIPIGPFELLMYDVELEFIEPFEGTTEECDALSNRVNKIHSSAKTKALKLLRELAFKSQTHEEL